MTISQNDIRRITGSQPILDFSEQLHFYLICFLIFVWKIENVRSFLVSNKPCNTIKCFVFTSSLLNVTAFWTAFVERKHTYSSTSEYSRSCLAIA